MTTVNTIIETNYPVKVTFDKQLKSGTLNGLTIQDKVHFVNEKDAVSWIEAVQKFSKDYYTNFVVETRKRETK